MAWPPVSCSRRWRGAPDPALLRRSLFAWAFNPGTRNLTPSGQGDKGSELAADRGPAAITLAAGAAGLDGKIAASAGVPAAAGT